ncbi:MAG: DUF1844 domain-containing protein [Verrucomicrobiia bacterium]
MAEVQKQNPAQSGELAQLFIQFVMMQSQNILFVLGKLPSPYGERMEPNLETAKVLIDQLLMIKAKTTGNLSAQETRILDDCLNKVQLAFIDASGGTPASLMPNRSMNFPMPDDDLPEDNELGELPNDQRGVGFEPKPESAPTSSTPPTPPKEEESRKKFFKSYG